MDFMDRGGSVLLTSRAYGGRPISFMSEGAKVPDDIRIPHTDEIFSIITGMEVKRSWIERTFKKSS